MKHRPYIVVVVLEAKQGKEAELQAALEKVTVLSRAETTNIEYRLHKIADNPLAIEKLNEISFVRQTEKQSCQKFVLYEIWESQEKHALQLEKSYIEELGGKLKNLLAKPYDIYYGEEILI